MGKTSRYSSLVLVLLCLHNMSFLESLNNGFSVEIIHRDSSRSPFYRSTETHSERVVNAIHRSINRANSLKRRLVSPDSVETVVRQYGGEYIMSYSVGTPPFQFYGIVDTGSEMAWMQCQPCQHCYYQPRPLFDPSKSTTYKTLPCSSTACQSLGGDDSCTFNSKETCNYVISYGDGSHSRGVLSTEALTLGSTNGSSVQFPEFVMGCGYDNAGTFLPRDSGVVGLGWGQLSLISQLSSSIDGKFSYCLRPAPAESNLSSKLSFGDDAIVGRDGSVSTPLYRRGNHPFYYVTLETLDVGWSRIEFASSRSTSFFGFESGNIMIDTGTTLTHLPDDVYTNLETEVAKNINLERVEDPHKLLKLCYKKPSAPSELDGTVITAHFTGGDIDLYAINLFIEVELGIMCFAFRSTESIPIFGNIAQQNILVGYDLHKNIVSFMPTDCAQH